MKRATFWRIVADVAIYFLTFCLTQWAVALVVMLVAGGEMTTGLLAFTFMLSSLIVIAVVEAMRHSQKYNILDELNPSLCHWKWAPLMLVATFCGMFCFDVFSEQLQLENIVEDVLVGLSTSFWGIIAIVLIGPIAEEVVFRSAILGSMLYHGTDKGIAVVVSALMFGIAHFNPAQIPFAFVIGLLFAILYVKSRSIIPCIVCHVVNNGISVIMTNAYKDQPGIMLTDLCGGLVTTYSLSGIALVICVVTYIYYVRKR